MATHGLTDQPPLVGYDLLATDRPLVEALRREGAGWAEAELGAPGARLGTEGVLGRGGVQSARDRVPRPPVGDDCTEAARRQDGGCFPLASGQSVGLIPDRPGAGEIVEAIVRQARLVLAPLPRRVRVD